MKKKIMFEIGSLSGGGAERVMVNLINHLDKKRYDILLLTHENKNVYKKDLHSYIKIINLNKKSRLDFFKLILKTMKIMRNYQPDAVLSMLYYSNIIVLLANLFLRRDYKIIISEHNYPRKYLPKSRLSYLKKYLMKLTYRKANSIVAVSEKIKRVLEEDFNVQSERIKTIYNPLPLEIIRSKSQKEVKDSFYKDKNAQVIISVGRLIEQKRFDRLLRALALVRKKNNSVRLIILGIGELQKELETLASQLKINKWVDFVGFKSNPYAWIAKADIFVLSSDYEGFPMVILEAMACHVPVISTDCPSGPGEIISNGKNGMLVSPANEKALADAMLTLLEDENLRIEKILPKYEELF